MFKFSQLIHIVLICEPPVLHACMQGLGNALLAKWSLLVARLSLQT